MRPPPLKADDDRLIYPHLCVTVFVNPLSNAEPLRREAVSAITDALKLPWLQVFSVTAVLAAAAAVGLKHAGIPDGIWESPGPRGRVTPLLNVSYDPTRELYADLNPRFTTRYARETGVTVHVEQSHGGSGRQGRAILGGVEADVATLALYSDTDKLRRGGLLASDWATRLPNHALPYTSTIVFRRPQGQPHARPRLARPDRTTPLTVVAPSPKTSGNGKLAFLAAWGSVLFAGGTEEQARAYVAKVYARVATPRSSAREATMTFLHEGVGDVHLTWENEALLERDESKGDLEIVYPPATIRAEPYVAWLDANVARHGTEAVARAYLEYLYSEEAQEVIAAHGYRPIRPEVLRRHIDRLPNVVVFPVSVVAKDWNEAEEKFFSEGGSSMASAWHRRHDPRCVQLARPPAGISSRGQPLPPSPCPRPWPTPSSPEWTRGMVFTQLL